MRAQGWRWVGVTMMVWAVPSSAWAQDEASASKDTPPIEGRESAGDGAGVIVYPPEFFASNRPNNALEMIRRLPGFTLDIGDIGARGLAGASGNVLIDGDRPSSKSDTLDQILQRIAVASVERIELIRGGAPGIDLQGRSVVANIVLKRSATREIAVEANAYGYDDGFVGPSLKLQYSARNGDSQTEASVYGTIDRTGGTADGIRARFAADGTVLQKADLDLDDRFRNFNARGVIQRRFAGGKLRANALIEYEAIRASQIVTVISGPGSDERASFNNPVWRGELGLDWTRPLGPRSEVELIALQRNNRVDFTSDSLNAGEASTFAIKSRGNESIGRAIWRFRPNKKWAFEAGGEIAYNQLDSDTVFTIEGEPIPLPNAAVLVSELRGEGFGQLTWQPSDRITIEAALRGEISRIAQNGDTESAKSFFYPKGRVQVSWQPAKNHQLRARIEQQVGQLDFDDFVASTEVNLGVVVGGNADLVPQRETVFELVYDYRFWKKGQFELTAQHIEIQDVVDVIPLIGGFEAVGNIGSGTADFIQARLSVPFDPIGIKDAILRIRTVWQGSSVTDPLTGEPRRLSNQIAFGCGVTFDHDLKGGRFSYGFDHGCNIDRFTTYRVREIREARNRPYVSVYGQWKPRRDLTIRLDLGNITDTEVVNTREIHSGPRNTAPISFIERRALKQGPFAYLQFRKTL